jgi:tryptophanyl-tRNA synthetase
MQTDPARVRRTDPGDPDKCPVWDLHKVYSNADTQAWVQEGCRSAGIGCLDCKAPLIEKIVEEVSGMLQSGRWSLRRIRSWYAVSSPKGASGARAARDTLDEVRQAMANGLP